MRPLFNSAEISSWLGLDRDSLKVGLVTQEVNKLPDRIFPLENEISGVVPPANIRTIVETCLCGDWEKFNKSPITKELLEILRKANE